MWLLGQRNRYRVDGPSMAPTLGPGDFVLARPNGPFAIGDVVVARHPKRPDLVVIKRVFARSESGLDLRGDSQPNSTDSRHWGPVAMSNVLGRVTCRV
jgi:nickel-type superoxide dismutase maturation protease